MNVVFFLFLLLVFGINSFGVKVSSLYSMSLVFMIDIFGGVWLG